MNTEQLLLLILNEKDKIIVTDVFNIIENNKLPINQHILQLIIQEYQIEIFITLEQLKIILNIYFKVEGNFTNWKLLFYFFAMGETHIDSKSFVQLNQKLRFDIPEFALIKIFNLLSSNLGMEIEGLQLYLEELGYIQNLYESAE